MFNKKYAIEIRQEGHKLNLFSIKKSSSAMRNFPEANLMISVLQVAIEDFKVGNTRKKFQAAAWLKENNDDYIFSSNSICEYLDIPKSNLLKKLEIS